MEWISVKDRLPEDDGAGMFRSAWVLITDGMTWDIGNLNLHSLAFRDGVDYWNFGCGDPFTVTHWAKVELP